MANPETELQRDITDALTAHGCLVYRLNSGGYRGRIQLCPPGTPDLLVIPLPGPAIWMEVKLPDSRISDVQHEHHADLRARGQIVSVVRSVAQALGVVDGVTGV